MLLTFSINANAYILGTGATEVLCNDKMNARTCGFLVSSSTTTSFPTLIVLDSQVDFSSSESKNRLLAEANGDADALLIPKLASELKVSNNDIMAAIKAIDESDSDEESDKDLSLENIRANLK